MTLHPWLAVACATLGAACSSVPLPPTVDVPPSLAAGADAQLLYVVPARGVQIYECRAGVDGAVAWTFVAPEATLFDTRGAPFGTHGVGPFWQARDGSRITGKVAARADAPVKGAIPWLLLEAHADGTRGTLAPITRIQRLNTVGGAAPVGGCTASTLGNTVRVAYAADYYLFATRAR